MSPVTRPPIPPDLQDGWDRSVRLATFLGDIQTYVRRLQQMSPREVGYLELWLLLVCVRLEEATTLPAGAELIPDCVLAAKRCNTVTLGRSERATAAAAILDLIEGVRSLLRSFGLWQVYEVAGSHVPANPLTDFDTFLGLLTRSVVVQHVRQKVDLFTEETQEQAFHCMLSDVMSVPSPGTVARAAYRNLLPDAQAGDPETLRHLESLAVRLGRPVETGDVTGWESELPDPDSEEQEWYTALDTMQVVGEAVWNYRCSPLSRRLLPRLAEWLEGYDLQHALAELERDFQNCVAQTPTPPGRSQAEGEIRTDAKVDLLSALLLSAADLARKLGQPVGRVECFLRRFRDKQPDCFVEVENTRKNDAHYLYRAGVVLPALQKQLPKWRRLTDD
jgi:hypothetical protein